MDPDAVFREWTLAADGVWTRRAARVITADAAGRILLMQGVDPYDTSSRTWWFTPGGGLEPEEPERDGAARELFEECGFRVDADDLVGPVAWRSASFEYFRRACRQDEVLFFVRLTGDAAVRTDGWTDVERASVRQVRWWPLEELAATDETIYPPALPGLAAQLVADGWDSTLRTVD